MKFNYVRIKRLLLISLFILVLFILFHNVYIIFCIIFLILFYNKIKIYGKLYKIYSSIEREVVAIVVALFVAILFLKTSLAVKAVALALGIISVLIAPFYPSAALSAAALGLMAEAPLRGPARAAFLALAAASGYLAGVRLSRSGLIEIRLRELEPKLERLQYDVIVKGSRAFYALGRGGDFVEDDLMFFAKRESLLYKCKKPRCLPLSIKSGREASTEFISIFNEYLYLLFPPLDSIEKSIIIYTNKENFNIIINKLEKAYVLSPRGAPNATADIRDVPLDKALKAVDVALRAAGIWSRELFQEAYLLLTKGGPVDLQVPGIAFLRDLIRGLDAWPDAVGVLELGEDPRSLLIAYLLQAKFGGYIVTFSEDLFELLRKAGATGLVLITDRPVQAKGDYLIVGPYACRQPLPLSRYAEKLRDGEYVGLVGGVPVHGFLWDKN